MTKKRSRLAPLFCLPCACALMPSFAFVFRLAERRQTVTVGAEGGVYLYCDRLSTVIVLVLLSTTGA